MKRIRATANGYVEYFEFDDDVTEEKIDETVLEWASKQVSYSWEEE